MTFYHEATFWFILSVSAIFEVVGNALIREGEKSKGLCFIVPGFLILGSYGLVLNLLSGPEWASKWINVELLKLIGPEVTFSMLLGVYVAVFASVSIIGNALFSFQKVPLSTWVGGGIIFFGGLVIRYLKF